MSTLTRALARPLARPLARSAALLTCVLPLYACSVTSTPQYREQRNLSPEHAGDAALAVETANGRVSIAAGTETRVEATLRGRDPERLAAAVIHTEPTADGGLRVWVEWPGGRDPNEGADLTITVPDAEGVRVATSNGRIEVRGLSGHADLRTSNGRVRVEDHDGPVSVTTSNGSVALIGVGGPVAVDTSNGSVAVESRPDADGPVTVETSNGRVELALSRGFAGLLSVDTSNGKVSFEGFESVRVLDTAGSGHARVRIGDSSAQSSVKTSNGSVRVRVTEPSQSS